MSKYYEKYVGKDLGEGVEAIRLTALGKADWQAAGQELVADGVWDDEELGHILDLGCGRAHHKAKSLARRVYDKMVAAVNRLDATPEVKAAMVKQLGQRPA